MCTSNKIIGLSSTNGPSFRQLHWRSHLSCPSIPNRLRSEGDFTLALAPGKRDRYKMNIEIPRREMKSVGVWFGVFFMREQIFMHILFQR